MAKRNDVSKMLEKYRPALEKLGSEVGKKAKKGEESLVTMSKLLKIQFDILGVTLQREKLYYDIGKDVADKLAKGAAEITGLEKYKKQLAKLQAEDTKKKKAMSKVKSAGKKSKK